MELTLDLDLREAAESLLGKEMESLTERDGISRGGAVAVVDVNTGGVLALASYPTYNLATYSQDYNTLKDDPTSPFLNRATQGTYARLDIQAADRDRRAERRARYRGRSA